MLLLCFLTSFVPFVCCDGGVAFSLFSLSAWRRPPPCRDHRPRGSRSCHRSVGPPSPPFLRRPPPPPPFLRLPPPPPPHQLPYSFPHPLPYPFPHRRPRPPHLQVHHLPSPPF